LQDCGHPAPSVVIVAGPAGSGKTTIGRALASALGAEFVDADVLHSAASIAKMRSGQPLDEDDRRPWLGRVRELLDRRTSAGVPTIVAVSALRRRHRSALRAGTRGTLLVWLDVPADVLAARLAKRPGHFFPPALLGSQLDSAEPPASDEDAIRVDASRPVDAVVEAILTTSVAPRPVPRHEDGSSAPTRFPRAR
jgi:gluconokinase